jgi:hypothetical protein
MIIKPIDLSYNRPLCDYYIKSAYNCCNGGLFSKGYVSTCILENIIKQGVRSLDFEIFSNLDSPIISSSLLNVKGTKETYNHVEIMDALLTINRIAFNSAYCNNYTDPILLHLRIKSNNYKMHDNLADSLQSAFQNKLLDSSLHSYEITQNNICDTPISVFKNKVIVIVHPYDTNIVSNNKMKPLINSHSNSLKLRILRNENILNELNFTLDEMKYYNTNQLTIVNPDESAFNISKQVNPDVSKAMSGGCQMIGIVYSVNDENYKKQNDFFNTHKSAFVLKPKKLLYKYQSKIYENIAKPIIYKF